MDRDMQDSKDFLGRIQVNSSLQGQANGVETARGASLRPGPDGWIRPPKLPPRPEGFVPPAPYQQFHGHVNKPWEFAPPHGNGPHHPHGMNHVFGPNFAHRPGYDGTHPHLHSHHNHVPVQNHLYPQVTHYEGPGVYESYESSPSPPPRYQSLQSSSGYGWRPPAHCTGTFMWVQGMQGSVPPNAVKVGQDKDGAPIFAGRAFHEGDLIPAKINPTHNAAYVAYGGQEVAKYEYEILCSAHIGWQTAGDGNVPPEAICVGQTQCGEKLYLGRTMHDGTLTPGKIQPSHNCLYISYGGEELRFTEYEVAVLL
ncbi:uncharacterized protein LOC111050462 isoform X1 [Nilaparvata lugens]|uniref:uncharacterized protein LOC111050462 isoform X1 n=1 Tax=Nilaparvata lugens TaxID=108931 RepID=UPI00193CFDBD|nr:uncharacterized protein LOC111050462 isoform X1 [Nilaparvata lugens]